MSVAGQRGEARRKRRNRRSLRQFGGDDSADKVCRARMLQDTAAANNVEARSKEKKRKTDREHARMYSSRGEVMEAVIAG